MDRLDAALQAGQMYTTMERTSTLVETALEQFVQQRGPFELVLFASGREKGRVRADLEIENGWARFKPVVLTTHPGVVDEVKIVCRDGTVVLEQSWFGLTSFIYEPDSTFRFDLGIVADLSPLETGKQYLRCQADDDQTVALSTRQAFGEPLMAVRDEHGRIHAFANNLRDLTAARREIAAG